MSGKKLQKLAYYCQAWSLAWSGRPLFKEKIEAWRDGPVVPMLFDKHRYAAEISEIRNGDPGTLTPGQMDTVDSVLGFYAERSADELIQISHEEKPWQDARRGLFSWQSGNREITHDAMRRYYSNLR